MIFLPLLDSLIVIIPVLLAVAFSTLMERKILGLSQYRKGPNKVSIAGVLQPFADAIKLFMKENVVPEKSNSLLFVMSPVISFTLVLMGWTLLPVKSSSIFISISAIVFLVILGLNLYPLLLSGWSSNNKYSSWGAIRGMAQSVSYETSLTLVLFSFLLLSCTLSLKSMVESNSSLIFITFASPLVMSWMFLLVMETGRTPFDFSEGESELVSGFNTEYSAGLFALIFLAEYGVILLFSLLSSVIMLFSSVDSILPLIAMTSLVSGWFWLRATFPRFRYDLLMSTTWKSALPAILGVSSLPLVLA